MFIKGQEQNIDYDFPVKPGTDAWRNLNSSQEMLDVCQIPKDIIQKISTEKLVNLCLNYPLLGEMLMSNTNYQDGFNIVSSNFNGFQELFKRKNAGTELMRVYENFDIKNFQKNKNNENVFFDMCIDIVMSQPIFFKNLNNRQKNILIEKSFKKLVDREIIGNSLFRQTTTAVVLSRLLSENSEILKNKSTFKSDKFLLLNNFFVLVDASFIEIIKQEASLFLKN